MADEELNFADEVSEFLRLSCPRRESWRSDLTEYFRRFSYLADHPVTKVKCKRFPVNTGSAAEFQIDPMLSCVSDVDVMYHYSGELAVMEGTSPPEQLPSEFDKRVEIFEILDSHLPGYVYLALAYVLRKSDDDGSYMAECAKEPNVFLRHDLYKLINANASRGTEIHGPACKHTYECPWQMNALHMDTVPCIRCLEWPPHAADWPSRRRNHGWPGPATIRAVANNGCDLVGVAHPLCKSDGWMSKHQWRLSFSRAEVTLLNSMTREQQIVYHMLRTFVKTERLTDNSDKFGAEGFSNYHVKMAILWGCESNPRRWQKCGSTLVGICFRMMHFLNEWLTEWHGQHYFISDVHLSDYLDASDIDTVSATVESTTVVSLARWFVDNYIRKCAELCPENIALLCSDVVTKKILRDTVRATLEWRDHITCQSAMKEYLSPITLTCVNQLNGCSLGGSGTASLHWFVKQLLFVLIPMMQKTMLRTCISPRDPFSTFSYFFLSTIWQLFPPFATSVENTIKNCFSDFISTLSTMILCFSKEDRRLIRLLTESSSESSDSVSALTKANAYMEFGTRNRRTTSKLVSIELAKMYLLKALRCKDSDRDSIFCLANVYLAVLYYATGQYQKAADHCTLVTRSQDHSQCSSHVVQGELLPKIDDDIDAVLGIAVFYQYVRSTALFQQRGRAKYDQFSVFTSDVFAHYFVAKCLPATWCHFLSTTDSRPTQAVWEQLIKLRNLLVDSKQLSISDLMLCKLPNNSHPLPALRRSRNVFPRTLSKVINFLLRFSDQSVMNPIHFYPVALDKSVPVASLGGFLPLWLYRCGLYDRCLELCQANVRDLFNADVCCQMSATYREFIQLMDNEIVSLVGLAVLANKTAGAAHTKFEGPTTVSQLALTLYLLIQSRIRLCYSSTSDTTRGEITATLIDVLDWIALAQKTVASDSFDQLLLKLAKRKAVVFVTQLLDDSTNDELSAGPAACHAIMHTFCSAMLRASRSK